MSVGSVNSGARITVEWPRSASTILDGANPRFLPLVQAYSFSNPHLSLSLRTPDGEWVLEAANPAWTKWRACDPTSACWYTPETFGRLIKAYIGKDQRRRLVRDFLTEFDGLSSTQKRSRILAQRCAPGASLNDLVHDGELDRVAVAALLQAMQAETKPVKPERLGVIGEANLRQRIEGEGLKYARATGVDSDGLPYVIEAAFAWNEDLDSRSLITAANFASSPALTLSLGWEDAGTVLEGRHAGTQEPVIVFLHVVHPRLTFTDLGKTRLSLSSAIADALRNVIEKITQEWHKQRKREERDASAELRRQDALQREQDRKISIKQSVYRHLPEAYERASGGYGARSHQIFYQLRSLVQPDTGRESLDSQYVEQTLIPDFIRDNPEICAGWTVLYDDRGNLYEPHTEKIVGLGTKNVRDYCGEWGSPITCSFELISPRVTTYGPAGRYSAILFCEKEGFTEIFQAAEIPERFDIALASTKGTSVTACRELFEFAGRRGIRVFVLHDFDYNGFEIYATLHQDTRRYRFKHRPEVINIGLRLETVERLALQSEDWVFEKRGLRENLRDYGATEEEIAFLVRREVKVGNKIRTEGKRVELNALTSPQIIELVETELIGHGVNKVIPDQATLAAAYRAEIEYRHARKAIEEAIQKARKELGEITVPDDLAERVSAYLKGNPSAAWEDAIQDVEE